MTQKQENEGILTFYFKKVIKTCLKVFILLIIKSLLTVYLCGFLILALFFSNKYSQIKLSKWKISY